MTKYHARPCEYDGHHFDSQSEARRYRELVLLERAGAISGLSVHPVYELQSAFRRDGAIIRPISYEGDFFYHEEGRLICEDVKGIQTEAFKIKRKLFLRLYPGIELRITRA